jgi:selenocysteine-specific elongation factor
VMARVLPRSAIEPGSAGIARIALEQSIVARGGDRFVLRSYSPVTTIGGGRILDPIPPRRRVSWPCTLAASEPEERFRALLERRPDGMAAELLPILLGESPEAAAAIGRREPGARLVGDHYVAGGTLERASARALETVRGHHRTHPSERGMPLETLRRRLRTPSEVAEAVVDDLRKAGRIRRLDGMVALAGFAPRVEGGDAEIDRIVEILEASSLTPPSVPELERDTGRHDISAVLRLAASRGRVEAVERDRYYGRAALERFVATLTDLGSEADITPGALRDRLGISRKYLIPLLEWADGKGITVRVGDGRRLKTKV